MNEFDFSGKTCPEGFTYVPAKISEYLKGRVFDKPRAKKAVTSPRPVGRGFPDRLPLPAC